MDKAAIRTEMDRRRTDLPPPERERLSQAACDALARSQPFARARTLLLYCAIRGEVATDRLVTAALAAGKALVLPRVQKRPRALLLHAWSGQPEELIRSAYGIAEPDPGAPTVAPATIDLVVVPGVAFDGTGARLGYGGGYYDRTLPIVRGANPDAIAVGLCYEFQVIPSLPVDEYDQRVDLLVTESGLRSVLPR